MNKKAQALALFITIIPVIFVVIMFVYESSLFVNKKSNTESILESMIADAKKYSFSDDEIIDLLKENGISEDDIEIVNHDKEKIITIKVKYPVINKIYEVKLEEKNNILETKEKENIELKKENMENKTMLNNLKSLLEVIINYYDIEEISNITGLEINKIKEYLK